jgi:hypothetical protein
MGFAEASAPPIGITGLGTLVNQWFCARVLFRPQAFHGIRMRSFERLIADS